MNNFLFETGTRFLFGKGCVKEYLASFLTGYGPSVLLVTEDGDCRSAAADEARDILRRSGKQAAECSAGPFCPRYEQVQQAARLCRERHVDLILGVGGSAVLDGCKAASLSAVCRGDLWENYGALQGVVDVPPLPVGFIASHLEVGAVNGAAGLLHESRCVWRDYPPCDPRFALLDPARTQTLSRRALIFQGFSALAGAMEEYLTLADGMDVSRELLEALMGGMVRALRVCQKDPGSWAARSDLMWRCALWGSRFFSWGGGSPSRRCPYGRQPSCPRRTGRNTPGRWPSSCCPSAGGKRSGAPRPWPGWPSAARRTWRPSWTSCPCPQSRTSWTRPSWGGWSASPPPKTFWYILRNESELPRKADLHYHHSCRNDTRKEAVCL